MSEVRSPPPLPTEEDLREIRAIKNEELPWLPPPPEANGSKFASKMKQNPFVPLGEYISA